jgi:hydrogenase maturation protease
VAGPLPAPVLLIGVGNDLRGDDAAGLIAARAVAGWGRPGVRIVECRQLLPELVPAIADAGCVVLIDAAVDGSETPVCDPAQVTLVDDPIPLSHGYTFPRLLGLTLSLEGRAPPGWVVAIPAEQFAHGTSPSAACSAGITVALRLLAALLPE